jgi:hypothetical protein
MTDSNLANIDRTRVHFCLRKGWFIGGAVLCPLMIFGDFIFTRGFHLISWLAVLTALLASYP